MEQFLLLPGRLLIIGDFNIHIDKTEEIYSKKFVETLDCLGLTQHVTFPTHVSGHTLDVIITRKEDQIISSVPRSNSFLNSDHSSVLCDIMLDRPKSATRSVQFRRLKNMDIPTFKRDVCDTLPSMAEATSLDSFVDNLIHSLQSTLDSHAPLVNHQITVTPHQPWFNDEIHCAKREKRRCERKWRHSKLTVDLEIFKNAKNHLTKLIEEAKEEYYSSLILNSKSDQKVLFKIIKNLLHKNNPSTFPSGVSDQDLALSFGEFFHQKIQDIHSTLDKAVLQPRSTQTDTPLSCCMNTFSNVSSDSIFKLIQNSPSKSCRLDALLTEPLKSCSGVLLKHITFAISSRMQ